VVLELDHVFCMVSDPPAAARRLEDDGWVLDDGRTHPGQGTRNRRLVWPGQFFELLWVSDVAEARANALHMDVRAAWQSTGASPVGLAFRGRLDTARTDDFWPYDALGFRIWIHHDNERFPERPLVLVLDTEGLARPPGPVSRNQPGDLREVRVHSPSAPSLPPFTGPPVVHVPGPHRLELVAGEGRIIRF
jgi:hypothetical protein